MHIDKTFSNKFLMNSLLLKDKTKLVKANLEFKLKNKIISHNNKKKNEK